MIDDSPRCYSMYAIHYTNWQYIYPADCYSQNSFTAPKWPRQPLQITGLARPGFRDYAHRKFPIPNYVRSHVHVNFQPKFPAKAWLERFKNRMLKSASQLAVSAIFTRHGHFPHERSFPLSNDRSNLAERRRKVGPKSQPRLWQRLTLASCTRIKATRP